MNPQDPLAALNPLREPLAVGWWPPAPGWWIVLLLALLAIAVSGLALARHYRKNGYRRAALKRLQILHEEYQSGGGTSRYLSGVNALLKSVALHAYPRSEVASRSGEKWLHIVNQGLPEEQQLGEEFNDAVYRKTVEDIDIEKFLHAARYWINHHKVKQ